MLAHPLPTGPTTELRWVVEQTDALRKFRPATSKETRERLLEATRHWTNRDLRGGATGQSAGGGIEDLLRRVFERFDRRL